MERRLPNSSLGWDVEEKTSRAANQGRTALGRLLHMLIAALITVCGIGGQAAWAGASSTTIAVTARVLPIARLTNLSQQEQLIISDTDVRQGFVEITNGSLIEMKNNNPNGCYLVVEVNGFAFEWASVNILGREIALPESGGIIHWTARGRIVTPIHYVVTLKPGTRPGVYPWPFHLIASVI